MNFNRAHFRERGKPLADAKGNRTSAETRGENTDAASGGRLSRSSEDIR